MQLYFFLTESLKDELALPMHYNDQVPLSLEN